MIDSSEREQRMTETFERENRTQLVHEVAQVLRNRIYTGRYPPGEALRQVQIASDLKISRTPLREALRLLEREGLVSAKGGNGVTVVSADFQQLMDAYAMREFIDGLAASEASQRADPGSGARLLEIIERQQLSLDPWVPDDYTRTNVEFHAAIVATAANVFLTRQLPIVYMTSQVFTPRKLMDRSRAVSAIAEHIEIAKAIAHGDRAGAEATARQHIRNTIQRLQTDAPAADTAIVREDSL
jgi:DNA-binding GntR family transcriptional regulator